MFMTGDAAVRTLRTGAALAFITLLAACERGPSAPNETVATAARPPVLRVARARVIEPGDTRIPNPPEVDAWFRSGVGDRLNMAFDAAADRFLVFEAAANQLVEMPRGADGRADRVAMKRLDARTFGVRNPQGMTVDPASGRLFLLDEGRRIVRVDPDPVAGFAEPSISTLDLAPAGLSRVRGIAFDPASHHFHVMDPAAQVLHEISQDGRIVASRDLSEFYIDDPEAMTLGPTGDATDNPSEMGVYIAAGGRVTEISLITLAGAPITGIGTLVRTTHTSAFARPSPDPSGVTYATHRNNLVLVDGEVDEMSIYAGSNVFETTLAGGLTRSWTTLGFSREPTGAAYNAVNRHLFISSDDDTQIYEVDPGVDGLYGTTDDTRTSFDTNVFGCVDPEGVGFDSANGILYIADGSNAQVWRVSPGANGRFDGVAPAGDDQVTSFDTQSQGLLDPEGIAFDSDFGHLYVVGRPETQVFHMSTTGALIRTIDISAAVPDKPAGLEYAPASSNPAAKGLYIVDRGVDNNDNPNENDGKMFEFSLPPYSGNTPPTTTITGPANGSTHAQGKVITFTGTASDVEDGNLTAALSWSSNINGALGNGGSVPVSTLSQGTHTITALVTDAGGAQSSASIIVIVNEPASGPLVQVRISTGTDDVEESATGVVSRGSTDLELVLDKDNQTVGLRFRDVAIPPGATITRSYVQFQVDKTGSTATSLTVRGEASDNAAAFTTGSRNVSSRARTVSGVSWAPPAWTTIGASGVGERTPGIVSVIQEIVNRPGWRSGNSMVIIITGTGRRTAKAFEASSLGAPLLRIEYSTGPNTAPTASSVSVTGTTKVGFVLTGNYTYSDAESDPEGTSTYRWLRNGSPIAGATTRTYALVAADEGAMIRFEVTPVAAVGQSPGTARQSADVGPVVPNSSPTASNVSISGTAQVGRVLTGNYTYSDVEGDVEGTSTYRWLRDGSAISGATARTYTLADADQGTMIVFEVTPVASTGGSPGAPAQSSAVGPVAAPPVNNAPTASNVAVSGTAQVGRVLTGSYTYGDADGDAEGTSTYRWLRNGSPIGGAAARTYTLVAADEGALVRFEVTPVAVSGASPGIPAQSADVGPIAAAPTVSASLSTVTASPNSIPAGSGVSTITVTVKDQSGAPMSGVTVVLSATGGGNSLTQPSGPTNASGVATGSLSSNVVEMKTISATANGTALTQTATVDVREAPPSDVITHTLLTSGNNIVNGNVFTTASISPAPNTLVTIAVLGHNSTSAAPSPTITGGGMTSWTEVATITLDPLAPTPLKRVTIFRAMSASPGSGPITITFSKAQSHALWIVSQWGGVDVTGINGAGAIGQIGSASSDAASGLTVALAPFANANNVGYGVFAVRSSVAAVTPGAGFTEIAELGSGESPPSALQAEWAANANSISASWANQRSAALGIEIRARQP